MTVNKYINRTEWLNRAIRTNCIYAHESRDTIKQWSFDKVGVKAMQFPKPNVNIDI